MKKGVALLFVGLILLMLGIYVSTIWAVVGTFASVLGGALMGASSYFFVLKTQYFKLLD